MEVGKSSTKRNFNKCIDFSLLWSIIWKVLTVSPFLGLANNMETYCDPPFDGHWLKIRLINETTNSHKCSYIGPSFNLISDKELRRARESYGEIYRELWVESCIYQLNMTRKELQRAKESYIELWWARERYGLKTCCPLKSYKELWRARESYWGPMVENFILQLNLSRQ